jgi:hypothetical protein
VVVEKSPQLMLHLGLYYRARFQTADASLITSNSNSIGPPT